MNPASAKLLLLVVAMLGIGGYVFYVTNPASPQPKKEVLPVASSTSGVLGANVSNVRLEGDGNRFTVTGLAQSTIDPELTSFSVSLLGPSLNALPVTFTRVNADLLIQNRTIKGGTVEIDLSTMSVGKEDLNRQMLETVLQVRQYPQAKFVITRVERGEGNSAFFVGDLSLRGMTKEVRVPFSRQGGALRGRMELDPALFGLVLPAEAKRVLMNFSVGVR